MAAILARRPQTIPNVIAIAVLLLAGLDWPYGYYTFLRWIVCAAACWTCWLTFTAPSSIRWIGWPFVVMVLLFNPIAPIHLDRETWRVIDIVAALVFAAAVWPATTDPDLPPASERVIDKLQQIEDAAKERIRKRHSKDH